MVPALIKNQFPEFMPLAGYASCIGELLKAKAKAGIKVRLLSWEAPFNAAGISGEANLPGKGMLRLNDRALQSFTQVQYDYDRQ